MSAFYIPYSLPNVRGQGTRHLVEGTLDPLVQRFRFVFDNGTGEGHSKGGSHLTAR